MKLLLRPFTILNDLSNVILTYMFSPGRGPENFSNIFYITSIWCIYIDKVFPTHCPILWNNVPKWGDPSTKISW